MSGIERLALEIVKQAKKDLGPHGRDRATAKQLLTEILTSRGLDPSRLPELAAR